MCMDRKRLSKHIWTIGHSTRSEDEFFDLLALHKIKTLVDVRRLPGSRRFPWTNQDQLFETCIWRRIDYVHLRDLGGKDQKPIKKEDSVFKAFRSDGFRGYAERTLTPAWQQQLKELKALATASRVAYFCAEAVWWNCHRSVISDVLMLDGWCVSNIMDATTVEIHPDRSELYPPGLYER